MNRNTESHFSELPSVDISRSIFDRSFGHMTSFNVGELIPIFIDEILAGDSVKITTNMIMRLQTMLTPTMSNMYADVYFFFDPFRLEWTHYKNFLGENTESKWVSQTEYTIPTINAPEGGFDSGTIADYLGIPVGVQWANDAELKPMALPLRAYARICDEFFRDQNLSDPLNIDTGDTNINGSNGSNYITDVQKGGKPFIVAKYHDFFTSMLPAPLKAAQQVSFPLLSGSTAPVVTKSDGVPDKGTVGMKWFDVANPSTTLSPAGTRLVGVKQGGNTSTLFGSDATHAAHETIAPLNLWADLSSSVGAVTINELRLAFQLQKFYEKQARGGTRMIEVLQNHFGVKSPDARLQRPEYLGGCRVPLNVHEVTNNSESQQAFIGDLGAFSSTPHSHQDVEWSATEPGLIIGLVCVRYDHTYSQGFEPFWFRRRFTDFYWPVFANLGEFGYPTASIYATASNMASGEIFGFNEAYADYRFKFDRLSGEMRPNIQNNLASWHLGDNYQSAPTLSDSWIREDKSNVDRILAVTSSNANQVFADFWFDYIHTRPMPVYSIPGLIDHH